MNTDQQVRASAGSLDDLVNIPQRRFYGPKIVPQGGGAFGDAAGHAKVPAADENSAVSGGFGKGSIEFKRLIVRQADGFDARQASCFRFPHQPPRQPA